MCERESETVACTAHIFAPQEANLSYLKKPRGSFECFANQRGTEACILAPKTTVDHVLICQEGS